MGIHPIGTYTVPSFIPNPPQQRHISAGDAAMFAALVTGIADQATISQAARDRAAKKPAGGTPYDFTNMSSNDILPTINSLIKSGQMSLDESSHLLLLVPISLGSSAAPAALKQKVNLFSALEDWMAFHKSIQNDGAVMYDQKAISALKRIQTSHQTEG